MQRKTLLSFGLKTELFCVVLSQPPPHNKMAFHEYNRWMDGWMDGEHARESKNKRHKEIRKLRKQEKFPLINSCSFNSWGEVASCHGFTKILPVRRPPAN